jgi:MoxR-like ATPase
MRGCLAYVRAAKTWAASQGRTWVSPDDIKELALPILTHRILLTPEAEFRSVTSTDVVHRVLGEVQPPSQRGAP